MAEFYFTQLNRAEQTCYRKLLHACQKGDAVVNLPPLPSRESIHRVVVAVDYDHPELFYADLKELSYRLSSRSLQLKIAYLLNGRQRAGAVAEVEQAVSDIIAQVKSANRKDAYEICLFLHDYFVSNLHYQDEALEDPDAHPGAYNIWGVFRNHQAVCEGIAKAYTLLCDRLGIDAFFVIGRSARKENTPDILHAWNIVGIGGEHFHVDVTWDLTYTEESDCLRYDYFGVPDRWMKRDHTYAAFYPACTTNAYHPLKRNHRWFTAKEPLERYLAAELAKEKPLVYFKMEHEHAKDEKFVEKLQDQIYDIMGDFCRESFEMLLLPNERQMCFFIRIQKN